jgi:hypothetical protein
MKHRADLDGFAMNSEIAGIVERVLRLPRGAPPAIVFSNAAYAEVLANWIEHAEALRIGNIVVVALDAETARVAAARDVISAPLSKITSHEQLWARRAELFGALAAAGIDFIHSDADAVWLRSPIDEIFGLDVDVAFSEGTIWPYDVLEHWGVVLCCGLFGVRAGPRAAAFFAAVIERMRIDRDDQAAVNRTLLDKGIAWCMDEPCEFRIWQKRQFRIFRQPLIGSCADLRVALLPHYQFPRLPEVSAETIVAHPLSPQEGAPTVRELQRLGLWRLPA